MSIQGFDIGPLTYAVDGSGDTGVSFTAGGKIPSNTLVTLTATESVVTTCMAGGNAIGIADGDVAFGDNGSFRPLKGRVQLISSGVIGVGKFVAPDNDGKVKADTGTALTANTIGQAETLGGTGTAIWVVCKN